MKKLILLFGIFTLYFSNIQAQCDQVASTCNPLTPFHSDGKYFRVQLLEGETAKLRINFNSGLVYRMISCSKSDQGDRLSIKIYDLAGKLVFDNSKDTDSQWDINFGASVQYTLEAKYAKGSGCAALKIGYLPLAEYKSKFN